MPHSRFSRAEEGSNRRGGVVWKWSISPKLSTVGTLPGFQLQLPHRDNRDGVCSGPTAWSNLSYATDRIQHPSDCEQAQVSADMKTKTS